MTMRQRLPSRRNRVVPGQQATRDTGNGTKMGSNYMSRVVRKPVFGVFDQAEHKPGCAATKDRYMLEVEGLYYL